jgi:hypothetical protein
MIVTVYGKDGTKTRKPIGYAGAACAKATEPYEAREIAGQRKKSDTPEAHEADPEQIKLEGQKVGG